MSSLFNRVRGEISNTDEFHGMTFTTPSIPRIGAIDGWFKRSMNWVDKKTGSFKLGSNVGVVFAAVQSVAVGALVGWALLSIAKELPFVGKWIRAFEAKYNAFFMKNVDAQMGKNITRGAALALTAVGVGAVAELTLDSIEAHKNQKQKKHENKSQLFMDGRDVREAARKASASPAA